MDNLEHGSCVDVQENSGICHIDIQDHGSCLISRNIPEQLCIQERSTFNSGIQKFLNNQ